MGGVFISNNLNYAIFPLKMLDDDKYKDFSSKEFFLYMLLLNRTNISKTNLKHFSDRNGVFVYYSNEQISKSLKCSPKTATRILNTLEQAGLIRKEYQKRGLPLKIYVNDIREGEKDIRFKGSQMPQDKFYKKPQNNSFDKQKPYISQNSQQEREVSFDVELQTELERNNLCRFSEKTKKRRTRNSGPTLY